MCQSCAELALFVLVTGRGKSGTLGSYSINLHLLSAGLHAGIAALPLTLLSLSLTLGQ